ncbi:MAG: ABC transporter permease [Patescibacteria group bacterium]
MHKYWVLFRTKLDEYIAFRLNFLMWRMRNIFNLVLLYYLWESVLRNTVSIQGYTTNTIFTYIFLANIIAAVVLSSKTDQVAGDILNGTIINQILKPMHFFSFIASKEVADKLINLIFAVAEVALFLVILGPPIFIQTDPAVIAIVVSTIILSIVLSFLISLSLSFIAFWSTDIWAPRFIFFVLISLLAGTMFPLDILPQPILQAVLLTPFPYLVYLPTKLYLFGITPELPFYGAVMSSWIVIMATICFAVWRKGMREFSFFGR